MINIRKWCFFLAFLATLSLFSCTDYNTTTASVYELDNEKIEDVGVIEEEILPPVEIVIGAVGDIMVHGPQLRAQYNPDMDEYNFTNNFKYIKPYLQEADLVIGNLETTFAGKEKGYSSYPMFNSPDTLADSLKEAGFDIISTANNHTIDSGSEGMIRTIEVLEDRGLEVIGTRKEESSENFIIKDVKDIRLGLTAYTYETPIFGDYRTLNALKIPKEIEGLINTFSYEGLDEDLMEMKATADKMKEAGAEVVIFYVHWGEEYQRQPNQYQKYIAGKLIDYGVDIILGSHPHVLQPIELLESIGKYSSPVVVYSMGNFISNQRYEILKNRYTEDGIIVKIKIKKNLQKKALAIDQVSYVPTWVHKYYLNGKAVYEIIPVLDALDNKKDYNLENSQTIWRVENSKNNTLQLIESGDVSLEKRKDLKEVL